MRQERLASYGCPVGSLTSELGKRDDDLRAGAGAILSGVIDWAEIQFRAMGREDARELATALIAAYEGIVLLAAALRDPGLIDTEVSRLEPLDRLTGGTSARCWAWVTAEAAGGISSGHAFSVAR